MFDSVERDLEQFVSNEAGGIQRDRAVWAFVPRLRIAKLADIPLLVRHRRKMWEDMGGYSKADLDAADPVYARWARPRLASGTLQAWIVEEKSEAIASGALWVMRIHPRPGAPTGLTPYLLSMYTAPEHRGKGHARRIVGAATAWARKEGYPRMTLHASDMGRVLYESLGWVATNEMKLDLRR